MSPAERLIQNCKASSERMPSQLDEFLGSRSSLTKTQIQRLSVYISLQNEQDSTVKNERGHVMSGVTEGAYYRVLKQAKNNVNQALYTLLLCSRMGVIRVDDLSRLLQLVGKVPSDTLDNADEVMSLVDALVKKIVML